MASLHLCSGVGISRMPALRRVSKYRTVRWNVIKLVHTQCAVMTFVFTRRTDKPP